MKRDRGYYREMREKHIKRKKKISAHYWHYKFDGQYSKGKIHCSCPICRNKTKNKRRAGRYGFYLPVHNWKHSDRVRIDAMDKEIEDYEQVLQKDAI